MPYPRGPRLGDAAAAGLRCTITAISPAQPLAGTGPIVAHGGPYQVVGVAVAGLIPLAQLGPSGAAFGGDRLSFVGPNGVKAVPSPISYDGQTLTVGVNFMGVAGTWHVAVEGAPESYAVVSNWFAFTVAPGIPAAYTGATGAHALGVVVASTVPIASVDGPAMQITGGYVARTLGPGTTPPRGGSYPGPGLLEWDGSAWQFHPVDAIALSDLTALFGDLPVIEPDLEVDPFGLPLPSAHQPYPVPMFYADGSPAYSPWYQAKANDAGTGSVVPSTPLPPTYTTYFQVPDNSPVAAGSSTTTAPVATAEPPVITQDADGNVIPGTVVASAPSGSTPVLISTLPSTSLVPAGASASSLAGVSPLLLLAVAAGAVLLFGRGRR